MSIRLCKIMNTSIYYVFIATRSYFVTPMPVGPSCSPLDGDERHDHPLLHATPGNQHVAQLLYRFWRIVPPGRLTHCIICVLYESSFVNNESRNIGLNLIRLSFHFFIHLFIRCIGDYGASCLRSRLPGGYPRR